MQAVVLGNGACYCVFSKKQYNKEAHCITGSLYNDLERLRVNLYCMLACTALLSEIVLVMENARPFKIG